MRYEGYSSPTKAEWEWLARKAGCRQATRFTWGGDYRVPEKAGNFADTAVVKAAENGGPVFCLPQYTDGFVGVASAGSFKADRAGLFNMSGGNVSEWAHHVYSVAPPPENAGTVADPAGPSFGESHVIKGSNWKSRRVEYLWGAYRITVDGLLDGTGFRVARYIH